MIGTLMAWVAGSRAGRLAAVALLATVAAVAALADAFRRGAAGERRRQQAASLDHLKQRMDIDDRVDALPSDERRRRLSRWLSGDGHGL